MAISKKVALKTFSGHYVTTVVPFLLGKQPHVGAGAILDWIDLGDGRVALKSAWSGRYVVELVGGLLGLTPDQEFPEWAAFHVTDLGSGRIALKSHNGQFVCAAGSMLIANRMAIGESETFALEDRTRLPVDPPWGWTRWDGSPFEEGTPIAIHQTIEMENPSVSSSSMQNGARIPVDRWVSVDSNGRTIAMENDPGVGHPMFNIGRVVTPRAFYATNVVQNPVEGSSIFQKDGLSLRMNLRAPNGNFINSIVESGNCFAALPKAFMFHFWLHSRVSAFKMFPGNFVKYYNPKDVVTVLMYRKYLAGAYGYLDDSEVYVWK